MTGSAPSSSRPVATTIDVPGTAATRRTSSRTAAERRLSRSTKVPSTSRATSRAGPPGASGKGRQDVGTDVRLQGFRHRHRAVGLLVVLQDCDDPPGRGQRAVEGRDDPVLALTLRVALSDAEPPSLVRRAVAGRRQLAIAALRRHPALTVELARRR